MGGFEFSVLSVSACSMLASVHPLLGKASSLTEVIIAATIEVHRNKGPGLIESIYEWCLLKELELRDLKCVSQKFVPFEYKGFTRDEPLRLDLLVEDSVLVEAKALEKVLRTVPPGGSSAKARIATFASFPAPTRSESETSERGSAA